MAWGSLRFDGHLGDPPGSVGWRTTSTETESPFSVRISDVNEVHNLASDRSTAVAECVIAHCRQAARVRMNSDSQ